MRGSHSILTFPMRVGNQRLSKRRLRPTIRNQAEAVVLRSALERHTHLDRSARVHPMRTGVSASSNYSAAGSHRYGALPRFTIGPFFR